MRFSDGKHCHWTYRHGDYVSPWYWPTRAQATHASGALGSSQPPEPEVYQVHGTACTCTDANTKESA